MLTSLPFLFALGLVLAGPIIWTMTAQESGPRAPLPEGEELAALPPDGGPEFNRLVFEKSPYLRQHARNPVDWYPWGEEAFARAAEEEKPVFLSIGYSTCHWCHVMEHESFEDPEVARLLNESYVCVKVDPFLGAAIRGVVGLRRLRRPRLLEVVLQRRSRRGRLDRRPVGRAHQRRRRHRGRRFLRRGLGEQQRDENRAGNHGCSWNLGHGTIAPFPCRPSTLAPNAT
jgi:hypothetical protein